MGRIQFYLSLPFSRYPTSGCQEQACQCGHFSDIPRFCNSFLGTEFTVDILPLCCLPVLFLEGISPARRTSSAQSYISILFLLPPALHLWITCGCLTSEHGCMCILHPEIMGHGSRIQAAYTYRSIWSAGFVIIGVLWPYCAWPSSTLLRNWKLAQHWAISCLVTAAFPLLPIDRKESLPSM